MKTMKTCKYGCGKMKSGGKVTAVKKMQSGGYAKPQMGGDNVKMGVYGIPNAGTTGPNRTAGYQYKKGGASKMQGGGGTWEYTGYNGVMNTKPTRSGGTKEKAFTTANSYAGRTGTLTKTVRDAEGNIVKEKRKSISPKRVDRVEKRVESKIMKKGGTAKAKFGTSVNVQRGYPGKIRSAEAQGYTAIGKREPERTKFQNGGSLKPVPSDKVGLSKLPTAVRNKMGYQKKGGATKKK